MSWSIAQFCATLLGLGTVGLGLNCTLKRLQYQNFHATSDETMPEGDPVFKAVRAHGNFVEYAGVFTAIMLYIDIKTKSRPTAWLSGVIALFTTCRFIHVKAILEQEEGKVPPIGRALGALGTYVCGALMCMGAALL
mmetsp:Transcript_24975/g.27791  ORF Transcript_24975/g.27791 Transcript_24975/m.27791 type:complete len:137 (-) Transcript_24975:122-532(-)